MHVTSDKPTQNDLLVATPGTTVMVLGTVDSPEKGVAISNESNQQPNINIDVSKPTVQPNEHILSPTKSVNPLLSKQLSVGSCDPRSPQRHGSSSDSSNLSVSQISEVTRSLSIQSEAQHTSSSVSVGMFVS